MLKGTVDGQKVDDLRLAHLTGAMQDIYKREGTWDQIVKVGTYGDGHTISVRLSNGQKHTWRFRLSKITNRFAWERTING